MEVKRIRDILNRPFTIRDLVSGYTDNDDGSTTDSVYGFNGNLNIRPSYQRNSVYNINQRQAVIQTVLSKCPLNIMYWVDLGNGHYDMLDGQQRTLSLCNFIKGHFSVQSNRFPNGAPQQDFPNLETNLHDLSDEILEYELDIYVCNGSPAEKMKWFHVINTAGEPLNEQELLNSAYTGTWLTDAKQRFSIKDGRGVVLSDINPNNGKKEPLLSGQWNRQEYLETAIKWACFNDGDVRTKSVSDYMLKHENDPNSSELWENFSKILEWVRGKFISYNKALKGIDWGKVYYDYHNGKLKHNIINDDPKTIIDEITRLSEDSEVTANLKNIYKYVIYGNPKLLQLRAFDDKIIQAVYSNQKHHCVYCLRENNDTQYDLKDMQADHIVPWSKGGTTTIDNCQLLCKKHNESKSNTY